ncbi:MAG: hypothetical protein AAB383_06595 [Patescibacteria group bacterium]
MNKLLGATIVLEAAIGLACTGGSTPPTSVGPKTAPISASPAPISESPEPIHFEGTMFNKELREILETNRASVTAMQIYETPAGNLAETSSILLPTGEITTRLFTSPMVDGVSKQTYLITSIVPSETGVTITVIFKDPSLYQKSVSVCDLKWSGDLISGTCSTPGLAEALK